MLASFLLLCFTVLLRLLLLRTLKRRVNDPAKGYIWRRRITYIVTTFFILLLAWIWSDAFESIATLLGLVAAALVLALKDLFVGAAGWAFIHWQRLFAVGDRIEIIGHTGDVIDIRLLQLTILEVGNWVEADHSTGRIIHVPNGKVLTEPLINYTRDFDYIWNEISVLITFESNWQKAKSILSATAEEVLPPETSSEARKQLNKAAERYMIFFKNLTPIVYTRVRDCGVQLTIRYLTRPRARRTSEHALWEAILGHFAKHEDIQFAYPTIRYYFGEETDARSRKAPGEVR